MAGQLTSSGSGQSDRPDLADGRRGPRQGLFLSLVIPAYNEANRLGPALEKIADYLAARSWPAEVLVVDNGSTDRTFELAGEFAGNWPSGRKGGTSPLGFPLRVLRDVRRGKGLAVRLGMLAARGEYRFLCDADLSMPIEQLDRFLPPALTDFDLAIATRESPEAEVTEPRRRRMIGRAFNLAVRALVLPGLRDTQCGFKCFTAAAAEHVFRRQRLDGLTFDVEALCIARRAGLKLVQVPITWRHDPDSRVRLVRDALAMTRDLLTIRRNARLGLYD